MPHKRAKKSIRDANSASQGYDLAPSGNINSGGFESKHVPIPSSSSLTVFSSKPTSKSNERKRKRASGKEQEREQQQQNEYGGMSKTVYRILNAERIRKEMKEKQELRKKASQDPSKSSTAQQQHKGASASASADSLAKEAAANGLKIRPGENLRAFNNRVEQTLRPEISAAVKQSKASRKKAKLSRSAQAKEEAAAAEAELHKPPPRRTADGAVKERASDFTQREKVRLNDVVQAPPTLTFGGRAGGKNKQRGLGLATDATKPKRSKELPVSMKQKAEMEAERERAIARYRELKARQLAAKGHDQEAEGDD